MCGIAGIFHIQTAKPVDPERVRAMADAQAHRGPDGSGVWTAPGVGLGHRRLSIIDIEGGAQPMVSEDDRIAVTYNGEIYNFAEVRADLQARGHIFRTASDTEVVLHGWREWGPDCLDRFDGMFAFALFDAGRQCLFLARDRLGVKPLHYAILGDGSLIFSSELKGLLAHPIMRREIDPRAIEDYLAFGYVPDDACIVAGVRKLAAGHHLLVERKRSLPEPSRWWDVDFTARAGGSAAKLGDQLRDHMRRAVRSRMVADVPLGAFLSGGVDSSSVVALMAEASPRAVNSFSIGFGEAEHDESAYAAQVADRFATDHRSRIVAADDFALIDTLAAAFDEPFADASALATYRLCQLARDHVKVALSGDGADEAMAGYRRYRFQVAEERVRALLPGRLRRPLFGGLGNLYPQADGLPRPLRAKATLLALGMDEGEAYARAVGLTSPELRAKLFSSAFHRELQGHRAEDRYVSAMRYAPADSALDRAQYADLKIWLPGDILTKVDRTSMAVGLEAREPLLDHQLVAFEASLSPSLRLRRGEGKWLMKKAMKSFLPRDILYRRKMGFVTPVSAWFRGALADEVGALARAPLLGGSGWFDPAAIDTVVAEHLSGRRDHGRLLWQLVMLERALGRLFGVSNERPRNRARPAAR